MVLEEQVPLFQGEDNTRYPIVLREYTRRKSSYDIDILSAFSGYLQRFICEKHYYGLFRSTSDNHMTWTAGHNSRPNDGKLPSWSWTSVIDKVSFSNSEVPPLATWAEPVVESFDSENIKRLVPLGLSTIRSECWNPNYQGYRPWIFLAPAWEKVSGLVRHFPGRYIQLTIHPQGFFRGKPPSIISRVTSLGDID